MPTQQEDEQLKQEVEKPKEVNLEEAARAAAQIEKEKAAAGELVKAEAGEPVAESAEQDQKARAREIAQKYLETIPEEDRKLTDPRQVEKLLWVLTSTIEPKNDLFRPADKFGNPPERVDDALFDGDIKKAAEGWREFVDDPVGLAKETDKVENIAKSTLPESVRSAIVSIILEEGDYSAVDMAKDIAEMMEKKGSVDSNQIYMKYSNSSEAIQDNILRQKAFRNLLEGLYPDLIKREDVGFLVDLRSLDYTQGNDRNTGIAMVKKYNQLFGGNLPFSREHNGVGNGAEMLTKLENDSVEISGVTNHLAYETRKAIAKKVISAKVKSPRMMS